jgi:hypothetical protein
MYALYSKSFAKNAVDLNKKEFVKDEYKCTAKSSGGGVKYELEATKNGDAGKAKVTCEVPVDAGMKVKLETNCCGETDVTADIDLADGMDMSLCCSKPSMTGMDSLSAELTYKDPAFSMEGKFGLFQGSAMGDKYKYNDGKHGFSAAFAMDCPGLDGITLGVNPAIGFIGDKTQLALPFALGGGDKAKSFAVTGALFHGNEKGIANMGLRGFFKVSDPLAVAFEVERSDFKVDGWKPVKALGSKAGTTFKVGAEYKASSDLTLKAKGTFTGGKPTMDFAAKHAMGGKNSATFSMQVADKTKVGFTYNLEA